MHSWQPKMTIITVIITIKIVEIPMKMIQLTLANYVHLLLELYIWLLLLIL